MEWEMAFIVSMNVCTEMHKTLMAGGTKTPAIIAGVCCLVVWWQDGVCVSVHQLDTDLLGQGQLDIPAGGSRQPGTSYIVQSN